MPSIITTTPNTLVRISPKDPHQLQYSDRKCQVWHLRRPNRALRARELPKL